MKLLAINGSPRKGNTSKALKLIGDAFPGIDFEILHLVDLDFKLCKGCYACVLKGESICPLEDDRDMILGKIAEADGLILASPVYSHMVSAPMKNFFDRFGYLAHRPQFFNKFAMSMVTYSGYGAEEALKYMDKMLSAFGFNMEKSNRAVKILMKKIEKGEKGYLRSSELVMLGCWTNGLMIFAQHPDRAWKEFVEEMPVIRNKKLILFTTYKIATGSMFRKMENALSDKSDPPIATLKSRSKQLTDKNRSSLDLLINS